MSSPRGRIANLRTERLLISAQRVNPATNACIAEMSETHEQQQAQPEAGGSRLFDLNADFLQDLTLTSLASAGCLKAPRGACLPQIMGCA